MVLIGNKNLKDDSFLTYSSLQKRLLFGRGAVQTPNGGIVELQMVVLPIRSGLFAGPPVATVSVGGAILEPCFVRTGWCLLEKGRRTIEKPAREYGRKRAY